jgi:hypothetical protein
MKTVHCVARRVDAIAEDLLRCALTHEPGSRLLGNITASEIVRLAAGFMTQCPACGAEAWVNIDCNVCFVVSALESGENT